MMSSLSRIVFFSVFLATCGHAQVLDAPRDTAAKFPALMPEGRKSVGLVLEGGGALGLAHVGVLRWLEENHVPVDRIAGTSMGALIGGLYASGKTPGEILGLASSDMFGEIFSLQAPYDQIGYRRRQDRRDMPEAITFGLKHGASLRNSVLSDTQLNGWLRSELAAENSADLDFDHLPVPFRCVATDLNSFDPVVFRSGSMPEAIRASISIPGVFPPVHHQGHYLVDGAMVNNLPSDVARGELQADVVIAVHLGLAKLQETEIDSILSVVSRTLSAGVSKTERLGMERADIVIRADTTSYSTASYDKSKELVAKGYEAAEQLRPQLIAYRLSDEDWAKYQAAKDARRPPAPGRLIAVEIDGGSTKAQQAGKSALAPEEGKTINPAAVTRRLSGLEASGNRQVSFETFHPKGSQEDDQGLLVHLMEDRNGPPFVMLGTEITASTSNVTRETVDVRYVHQDLGGYGSELRIDSKVGFLTQGNIEYYRPLGAHGFFVEPRLNILRTPIYLWRDQQRISERFQQDAGGGMDVGKTFSRNMQLSAEWRAYVTRWRLVDGTDASNNLSGRTQTAVVRFAYDNALTGAVSPRGWRIHAAVGSRFNTVASSTAPMLQASVSRTLVFGQKNILGFRSEGSTYFGRNVADPFRFTLGGPLRLSASSLDEYRGTDDYLLRAGYLRRVSSLPSGLGQGVYLTGAYEAGQLWSPERAVITRQDFVGGVVASTPLGVITLVGSIGDSGHRKIAFVLGKLF